jgi:hypothetical protein
MGKERGALSWGSMDPADMPQRRPSSDAAQGPELLLTRESFERFVADWEAGTLPKPKWTHAAHVAVGACYTVRYGQRAFEEIKQGILRYNAAVGTANTETSGYHENPYPILVSAHRGSCGGMLGPLGGSAGCGQQVRR